jgi:hypothetical protein
LRHAEHLVYDGAGHMLPIERADEVTAAIARLVTSVLPTRRIRRALRGLRRTISGPEPDHAAA